MKGKAKLDFEEWFLKKDFASKVLVREEDQTWDIEGIWHELPDSMQFGVIVDWADSVGLEIVIHKYSKKYVASIYLDNKGGLDDEEVKCNKKGYSSRQQAREKAIEKLNEIYNK